MIYNLSLFGKRFVPAPERKRMDESLNWDYTDRPIYRRIDRFGYRIKLLTNYHTSIKFVNERRPIPKYKKKRYRSNA